MTDWDKCQGVPTTAWGEDASPDAAWSACQGAPASEWSACVTPPDTGWPTCQLPPDTDWGFPIIEPPPDTTQLVTTQLYPIEIVENMRVADTVLAVGLWRLDFVGMDPTPNVAAITVFQTLFEAEHNQPADDYMFASGAVEQLEVFQTLLEHDQPVDDYMMVVGAVVSLDVVQAVFPISHDQPIDGYMEPTGAVESVIVFES